MSENSCFDIRIILAFFLSVLILYGSAVFACTGIQLEGKDGTVVRGRTMEWGAFDMETTLQVVPRDTNFVGLTPDGVTGHKWKSKYGFVALVVLEGIATDGMNEKGLSAGGFFHKGFAEYTTYDPERANSSIAPSDFLTFILSNFSTIKGLKEGLRKISVVPVIAEKIGMPWPAHAMVTQPDGECVVIEFTDGKIMIYDNPVGVITNNPNFPWHLTNLRNYGCISNQPFEDKKWGELDITPLAGGSGMLGLPGDFTAPSRFVRAVVFSQYSRHTKGGIDTVNELFRILDNFNEGITQAEGSDLTSKVNMPSATQWTVAFDTKNLAVYYHTMFNRRIRKADLKKIDFSKKPAREIPLDKVQEQEVKDITELVK